jgi:predicted secreted acid phosphatase
LGEETLLRAFLTARHKTVAAVAFMALLLAAFGAVAFADNGPHSLTFTPQHENDITNIDVLRQQIANYYGDPTKTGVIGADSNYAHEAEHVANDASHWLDGQAKQKPKHGDTAKKAIVLDVDDTTLATWNYEVFSNWAYNPTTNAQFVTGEEFPAVPGMVDLVNQAAQEGYAIFFLTGRPTTQADATLGNLTDSDTVGVDAGYPHPTQINATEDGLFLKPAPTDYPAYLVSACANDPVNTSGQHVCTTTDYKSATRAHIESEGYDIVANMGDQFSDLNGGYADRAFKMPNPNYYLP